MNGVKQKKLCVWQSLFQGLQVVLGEQAVASKLVTNLMLDAQAANIRVCDLKYLGRVSHSIQIVNCICFHNGQTVTVACGYVNKKRNRSNKDRWGSGNDRFLSARTHACSLLLAAFAAKRVLTGNILDGLASETTTLLTVLVSHDLHSLK